MDAGPWMHLWYGGSHFAYLLAPLAGLYGAACLLRRGLYRLGLLAIRRLPVPVVIVGNITAGGTGKTPLTIWLARELHAAGFHPGVVCRSYRAAAREAARVAPTDDPRHAGDEAVLLAARLDCPVYSGPDRAATAVALLALHPDIDVIVCDDGLQHYALARDVEIAVIDANRGFGNGMLLPAGPLREPRARLGQVDAIVINGGDTNACDLPDRPAFRMDLTGTRFRNVCAPDRMANAAEFTGERVVAIAGIGNPDRFFEQLRTLGIRFDSLVFDDHHAYSTAELACPGYDILLMTEKDAIKCARFGDTRMWALPIDAALPAQLKTHIVDRVTRAAARTTRTAL